ncbi:hypothetical protein ACIHCV_15655 [Streptomyces sp. NPDC051956]|uniref:hypothetical protein n=1 Tax=Streptomyces sp. NPDC051956 TaxID=3365677 RepID=UPI0037D5EF6D
MHSPIDPFMPAVELAAAIRRKEVSPVEVADCFLERMDRLDPALNVLARHDPAAWWSPPTPRTSFAAALRTDLPTGLRIGALIDSPIDGIRVHPACVAAVDNSTSGSGPAPLAARSTTAT